MNPELLQQLRALLAGAGAPADVTAAPRGGPPQQMIPVMRERVAGAPQSPVAQRGVFGAILRSAEPSEDTPMGWANEMFNPIRQGAAARETAGRAVSAARQGQIGKMAGMAALTAMAVPGVPGNSRAANVAEDLIDVGGAMRPRLNSLGQPIHPTEEGIRNFWRWFGKSQAVDDAGRPLVVYHGTQADIEAFRPSNTGIVGPAIYTTDVPDYASDYATRMGGSGGNVMPLYARIESQIPVSHVNKTPEEFFSRLDPSGKLPDADVVNKARQEGFDGVFVNSTIDPNNDYLTSSTREIVGFSPFQFKSAIGNTGAFDPSDPRITRSIAALLGAGAAMRQQDRQPRSAP
jgi:hypothetical protein